MGARVLPLVVFVLMHPLVTFSSPSKLSSEQASRDLQIYVKGHGL